MMKLSVLLLSLAISQSLGEFRELGSVENKNFWVYIQDGGHEGETKLPWEYAKEICEGQGQKLAQVDSAQENDFLTAYAPRRRLYWLGAKKEAGPATEFKWESDAPMSYTKFRYEPYPAEITTYLAFDHGWWVQAKNESSHGFGALCEVVRVDDATSTQAPVTTEEVTEKMSTTTTLAPSPEPTEGPSSPIPDPTTTAHSEVTMTDATTPQDVTTPDATTHHHVTTPEATTSHDITTPQDVTTSEVTTPEASTTTTRRPEYNICQRRLWRLSNKIWKYLENNVEDLEGVYRFMEYILEQCDEDVTTTAKPTPPKSSEESDSSEEKTTTVKPTPPKSSEESDSSEEKTTTRRTTTLKPKSSEESDSSEEHTTTRRTTTQKPTTTRRTTTKKPKSSESDESKSKSKESKESESNESRGWNNHRKEKRNIFSN